MSRRPWHTHEWNDLGGFCNKSVGEVFIEGDEMSNVNVAVVLLRENILANLISVLSLATMYIQFLGSLTCK